MHGSKCWVRWLQPVQMQNTEHELCLRFRCSAVWCVLGGKLFHLCKQNKTKAATNKHCCATSPIDEMPFSYVCAVCFFNGFSIVLRSIRHFWIKNVCKACNVCVRACVRSFPKICISYYLISHSVTKCFTLLKIHPEGFLVGPCYNHGGMRTHTVEMTGPDNIRRGR